MKLSLNVMTCAVLAGLLISCSKDNSNNSGGNPNNDGPVNWGLVGSKHSPQIEETKLQLTGVQRINMDLYGYADAVSVKYDSDSISNIGVIKGYNVSGTTSYGWERPRVSAAGSALNVKQHGSYSCSIKVVNGEITELEGRCYVQIEVLLPKGAQIEVYNVGKLISQRFYSVSNDSLVEDIQTTSVKEEKFKVIDTYLKSYSDFGRSPQLTSHTLGLLVGEFSFRDDKFQVLRLLQSAVTDRGNLVDMINDKFTFFDREEALKICGITEG